MIDWSVPYPCANICYVRSVRLDRMLSHRECVFVAQQAQDLWHEFMVSLSCFSRRTCVPGTIFHGHHTVSIADCAATGLQKCLISINWQYNRVSLVRQDHGFTRKHSSGTASPRGQAKLYWSTISSTSDHHSRSRFSFLDTGGISAHVCPGKNNERMGLGWL